MFLWLTLVFLTFAQAKPGANGLRLAVIFDREISSAERTRFDYLRSNLLGNNEDQLLLPEAQNSAVPKVVFDDNLMWAGQGTLTSVNSLLSTALNEKNVDAIILMGPIGAKAGHLRASGQLRGARKRLSKPVFAASVWDAEVQGIGSYRQNRSGLSNFTFSAQSYALDNDIRSFTDLVDFSHAAIIVDQGLSETFAVDIREYINNHSPKIRKTTLFKVDKNAQELLGRLGSAPIDAKAMFVTALPDLDSAQHRVLFSGLNSSKIPTYSTESTAHTIDGALASCASDLTDKSLLANTADQVQQYLTGASLAKLKVYVDVEETMMINMATAASLNVSPSWEVLASATLLPSTDEVLREVKLSDAFQFTVDEHPALRQAELDSAILAQQVVAYRSSYLPQLEAVVSGQFIDSDQRTQPLQQWSQNDVWAGLMLDQTVWSASQRAEWKMSETRQLAAALELEQLRREIRADTVRIVYSIARLNKEWELQQSQHRRLLVQRDVVRRVGSPYDLRIVETNLMQQVTLVLRSKSLLDEARSLLQLMLQSQQQVDGLAIVEPVDAETRLLKAVTDPRAMYALDRVLSEAAADRALELKQNDVQRQLAEQRRKASTWAMFSPEISVSAALVQHLYRSPISFDQDIQRYNQLVNVLSATDELGIAASDHLIPQGQLRNDTDWLLGFQARLPLFDGLKQRSELEQAKLRLLQLDEERRLIEFQISQDVQHQVARANAEIRAYEIYQDRHVQVVESYNHSLAEFEKGGISIDTLQQANAVLQQSEILVLESGAAVRKTMLTLFTRYGLSDFYIDDTFRAALFEKLTKELNTAGFIGR